MNFMKSFLCLSLFVLLFFVLFFLLIWCPVFFNGLENVFFSATAVNQNVEMSDGNNTQQQQIYNTQGIHNRPKIVSILMFASFFWDD